MNEQNQGQIIERTASALLPTSTLAIVSLITGILSYTGFPLIGAIVAIITGNMARQETRALPPKASGDGMATAGIILGWVHVGLIVATLICVGLAILFSFGLFGGIWHSVR